MPLTCGCSYDWDPEPGDWYYDGSEDYTVFPQRRRKRCASKACDKMLSPGDTVAKFIRHKIPNTDVECEIYGEDGEIPLAPDYLCEECADMYWSLDALGFCVSPREDMRELIREYNSDFMQKVLRGGLKP